MKALTTNLGAWVGELLGQVSAGRGRPAFVLQLLSRTVITASTELGQGRYDACDQSMKAPPFTAIDSPVMNAASSLARNATTFATSSASSSRFIGVSAM